MGSTFGVVKLFKNFYIKTKSSPVTYTEYEEGSLHRPIFKAPTLETDAPPYPINALYTFTNVTPRKGYELSAMELPIDHAVFESVIYKSYDTPHCVYIEPIAGSPNVIIGWIDRIEPVATKGPLANTRIFWHVDYYLTGEYFRHEYLREQLQSPPGAARPTFTYGRGRIKRGPESLARPDPSLPRRWRFSNDFISLTDSKGPAVVVIFNDKNANGDTVIKIASWWLNDTITPGFQPITIQDIYSGLTEECMGIDPDSIIGIYFAPFMPISTNTSKTHQYLSITYGWWEAQSGDANIAKTWVFVNYHQTTDYKKWVFLDPLGTTYATLPWNVKFNQIEARIDVGTSGASVVITLLDSAESYPHQHLAEGRRVQIPLISAPVTSNAMASYVLSGKQEYDRAMATIQQEQNFKSGIANAGTGAIGGAIAGSAASPGIGTAAGLIGGAASSVLGSYVSGEVQKETDRKSFEALDRYTSNQTSSVIISAGGTAWVSSTAKWMIVALSRDSESTTELYAEQTELGYVTDSFVSDCSTIIATGGGLRIEGLEIKGNISPEGRAYIAALFERGVHLDLIS